MMESESETARGFWAEVDDVDGVFEELMEVLKHLRHVIRENTATNREYVQAMKIIQESKLTLTRSEAIEEVLIDEEILTVTVSESQCSPERLQNGLEREDLQHSSRLYKDMDLSSDYSQMSSTSRTDALLCPDVLLSPRSFYSDEPKSPVPLVFQPHNCSAACVPRLPAYAHSFVGHNPLQVPMVCHFQRFCSWQDECEPVQDADVLYKAPCGRSLCCMEEVLEFLLQSESLGVLHTDHFSFNAQVDPGRQVPVTVAALSERDLSRGIEPVPVSLFNAVDDVKPKEFRYRKERWPHGCFLSAEPFFSVCCDCVDGCADPQTCACVQRTARSAGGSRSYTHQRLSEPVSTGLFECGPWCGCDRSRCQNRVVQKGLRVRLQVFRTPERSWAVRCRDDLDTGTFICIYAGVVLRLQQSSEDPADVRSREPAVSDDEVEVVEEWTIPSALKETVSETLDCSPPLYVPVIQRPADQSPAAQARDQQQFSVSSEETENEKHEQTLRKKARLMDGAEDSAEIKTHKPRADRMYYLDASKEGNVARFISHSCDPNLFIQNVFTDTHDPQFPLIAFFTNRSVKAGTELTWSCWNTADELSAPDTHSRHHAFTPTQIQ